MSCPGLSEEAQAVLERLPGAVGMGYGLKERGGSITRIPALRVYVRAKRSPARLSSHERIPAMIGGLPTDVIEHSAALPTAGTPISTPASGSRIANAKGVPGTLGCFCRRSDDQSDVLLTSWHVLFGAGARERSRIWAIEERDGVRHTWEIGRSLYGTIGTVSIDGEQFHIDCAVGSRAPLERRWRPFMKRHRPAPIHGEATAMPGDRVTKIGSATGETAGVIVDVSYPDLAVIDGRTFTAPRQVLVRSLDPERAFSAEGDSGSAVLNDRGEIVALLWGTNCRGEGVACHIRPIVRTLQLTFEPKRRPKIQDCIVALFRKRGAPSCS